jgi:hypothetical protein
MGCKKGLNLIFTGNFWLHLERAEIETGLDVEFRD